MRTDENIQMQEELSAKILKGVQKALNKLAESAASKNESLVVGDEYGNYKTVPAKVLLKELQEKDV